MNMNTPKSGHPLLRLGLAAMLLGLSSFAVAGSTIKVVNNSSQPWLLRITSDPSGPVLVQGGQDPLPTELGKAQEILSYRIQPGQTCTLQFKEHKDKPAAQDIGLVDGQGVEKGHFTMESKAPDGKQLAPGEGRLVISVPEPTREISAVEEETLLRIFADSWC
jgi:hypothetical protein